MTRRSDEMRLSVVFDTPPRPLVIGLVNNMPRAAFEATAAQFDSLLRAAMPDGFGLQLRFFSPPDASEAHRIADLASRPHEPAGALWTASLDGLIVTGAEPQAVHIADEPCLPFLSRIVDWADAGAVPAIWSCLAAHAAVYHLDGIVRRPRETKLFGVFECDRMRQHPLLNNNPGPWTIPHSRHNDLLEKDLASSGYEVLTHSQDVGVDTFIKRTSASHVFLNGHPEYGPETLYSEYRRDVRRFLTGQKPHYPATPTGYFRQEVLPQMAAFQEEASARPLPDAIAHFPTSAAADMSWRNTAITLFHNWLQDIARRDDNLPSQSDVPIVSEPDSKARLSLSPALGSIAAPAAPIQNEIRRQAL